MSLKKRVEIRTREDVESLSLKLRASADRTLATLARIAREPDGLIALAEIKFALVGVDPLDVERELHFVEQINQTFTYAASLKAVGRLIELHPEAESFVLNLGTNRGSDIESDDCGGIVAEVFAATNPNSNDKLAKDLARLSSAKARFRYVFFMCPGIPAGPFATAKSPAGVLVESLGVYASNA